MAQTADVPTLTAEIVAAFVGANSVRPADVVEIIRSVRATLTEAEPSPQSEAEPVSCGVTHAEIRKSICEHGLVSSMVKPTKR